MANGSEVTANLMFPALLAGKSFAFPTVDSNNSLFNQPGSSGPIHDVISTINIADFTSGAVGGSGTFDIIMSSVKAHLKEEYNAARISGAEYTKAYIGLVTAAMSTASQILLTKDQAYWQALLVQQQAKVAEAEAVKARVELEMARVKLTTVQYEAAGMEASYVLTKLKLATEDATYGNLVNQGLGIKYTNDFILPKQKDLLQEQVEVQRAQTLNSRTDGATVVGTLGKQKDLYSQQITSYQRDAELKATKLFTDSWITQKTIDEGLLAPTNFTNASLDVVLGKVRTNLGLV